MTARYVSLIKLGFEVIEVSREIADTLEEERLVILTDDGTGASGHFVPARGVRAQQVRKRLKELLR